MRFKVAFGISFAFTLAVAARAAGLAARRHGGAVNQLAHEIRSLCVVRAALGLVFYAALVMWMFWPRSGTWMHLPLPLPLRWTAAGLLILTLPGVAAFVRDAIYVGDLYNTDAVGARAAGLAGVWLDRLRAHRSDYAPPIIHDLGGLSTGATRPRAGRAGRLNGR